MNQLIRILLRSVLNGKTRMDRNLDRKGDANGYRSAARNTRNMKQGLNLLQRVSRLFK